jgi:hypothetical protein
MGSVGDAYDNAMCESFFATLECELLDRRRFASQAKARVACFSFIEGFYNPVRLHSALGYRVAHPLRTRHASRAAVSQALKLSTKPGQLQSLSRSSPSMGLVAKLASPQSRKASRHPLGVAAATPSERDTVSRSSPAGGEASRHACAAGTFGRHGHRLRYPSAVSSSFIPLADTVR